MAESENTRASSSFSINRQVIRGSIIICVLAVSLYQQQKQTEAETKDTSYIHGFILLHLLSFASWFGCSMWVSFVAGIVMFKTLPRHTFGKLQSKLFPAYFQFSLLMICVCLMTSPKAFGKIGNSLWVILATVLLNLVYLEPKTTKIMFERHVVERRLGTGHEIGQIKPSDPEKANDPELRALSKKFGMFHGMSSLSNLVALCAGCVWLNLIAGKIIV